MLNKHQKAKYEMPDILTILFFTSAIRFFAYEDINSAKLSNSIFSIIFKIP